MTNIAGVDLYAVYDALSATTPEIPAAIHTVGEQVMATDGSIWVFGKAAGTITQNDTVAINNAHDAVVGMLGSNKDHIHCQPGNCANAGMTSGQFGWFMIHGKPTLRIRDKAAKDVQLYSTNETGCLSDVAGTLSFFPIRGVFLVSSITSATATVQSGAGIMAFPHTAPTTVI
jgi:hypothetical protein